MRHLIVLAVVVLVCGCVCLGGKDVKDLIPKKTGETQETGSSCDKPYIRVGSECCLDNDDNGICDSDEEETTTTEPETDTTDTTQPPEPTTTVRATTTTAVTLPEQATTTTASPTTTAPQAASCSDGVQNGNEEYADCGGTCSDCVVMKLDSGWQEFKNTGYKFRFDQKEGVAQTLKYWVEVKTPDGITDRRPISTGESFIDYLRFKAINYGDEKPRIYVKVNTEDLAKIRPQASLITIGGQSCAQMGSQMCERNYQGYKIRYISRAEGGAKITIYGLDGVPLNAEVTDTRLAFSEDHAIGVGGFFDKTHFIQGGSSLFYAYTL
jgi:hypothetical protein